MAATESQSEEPSDVAVPAPTAQDVPSSGVAAPGSAEAVAAGCSCSVLANAAYRIGVDDAPLLDPACPLEHG